MIYEHPYYIEEIRESQCRPDVLWGRTEIMESRKSKSREISLKARGRKKDNVSLTVLWESREKREWKSRVGQINSLKARGEEERQCEPVGTWRKRVKRSLLLSTATRRGLAGACLSPPPSPSGDPCYTSFSPFPPKSPLIFSQSLSI